MGDREINGHDQMDPIISPRTIEKTIDGCAIKSGDEEKKPKGTQGGENGGWMIGE